MTWVFLRLPFQSTDHLQQIGLVLNTALLVLALAVIEVGYGDAPKEKRQHLRYFYPLFIVVGLLLIFTIYKQLRSS